METGRPQTRLQNVAQADRHLRCPKCAFRRSYKLADGRRMCARCRTKYTARRGYSKLEKPLLREIARLFWLMVPATRVAKDLGLNRKTVLQRYTALRAVMAQESEAAWAPLTGEIEVDESYFGGVRKGKRGRGARGKIPVFGLLQRRGEVRVVFPAHLDKPALQGAIKQHVEPLSWVYSDGYRAYDQLDLEGFHHVRVNHEETLGKGPQHINGIENFWGFAKRRLKLYHGGYKRNFVLFIREMEYRFNHRNDPAVIERLSKSLISGPK
jgi:transposase